MHTRQLTAAEKQSLKATAMSHISGLRERLQQKIADYQQKIEEKKSTIPHLENLDLFSIDPDSQELELLIAKIKLYDELSREAEVIRNSPYFLRMDVSWEDTDDVETIYISKNQYKEENIFSWVAPIATLRYAEMGAASYARPDGRERHAEVSRKDNFLITNGEIVFMTFQDSEHDRQVVFQKHFDARRDFLLPEIVAELDKLQDEVIRSDPKGWFLISGPAGSGKTTLALHRIAYLVLTPEFKDFFVPEEIVVFVSNAGDIKYFGGLLPELGINGVRITTFMEWATMIANSRFRAKVTQRFKPQDQALVEEFVAKQNPLPEVHPRIILDEYRRLKQQVIMELKLIEGSQKDIYPKLHELYLTGVDDKLGRFFREYLNFQKQNKFLDEVDLTIILMSLENPISPFAHVVIDEVQNWLPEQLQVITALASRTYNSVTFIGDIRQKTKVFSINDWGDIDPEFAMSGPRRYELLNVYRNTKQILQYLSNEGYEVVVDTVTKQGPEVEEVREVDVTDFVKKIIVESTGKQVGIIGRFHSSLAGLENLGFDNEFVHVLTAESAQGLEFDTVIIIDKENFSTPSDVYRAELGLYSANEYAAQNKHLFYVAATRAQERLVVVHNSK